MFPRWETEIGGQNEVKKQLPGWAVLLIITLVAGLALGGTNALTKDPIAQQARIKASIGSRPGSRTAPPWATWPRRP